MNEQSHVSIRGSSLLLGGRLVALVIMALVQVLIVRYLPPVDYGRWTYALSIVTVLQSVAALGLDRAVARFIALYYERGDHGRLAGLSILLLIVVGAVCLTLAMAAAMFAWNPFHWAVDPTMLRILSIVLLLVPIQALDALLAGYFSCFGRAGAIFRSRHVVTPGLKLAAVVVATLMNADVRVLAAGFVGASFIGILMYLPPLVSLSREFGLTMSRANLLIPVREVFAFTAPLLIVDFAGAVMQSAGALLLGYLTNMQEVAIFAAALPLAHLNQAVMRNFSLLYTSSTSRLLAREDHQGINELYWRTTVWMALLTFPVFALTFGAANELTLLMYGEHYRAAGPILAVLALGEYVNVALGFNGLTLRVLNRARYLVAVSVVATVATVIFQLMLIPRFGALGAAIGACAGLFIHNCLKQMGLRLATGIHLFEVSYRPMYAAIAVATATIFTAHWLIPDRPFVVVAISLVISVGLVLGSKRVLHLSDVFPEVRRIPLLGALLA